MFTKMIRSWVEKHFIQNLIPICVIESIVQLIENWKAIEKVLIEMFKLAA